MSYIKTKDSVIKKSVEKAKNIHARTRDIVEQTSESVNPYKSDERNTDYAEKKTTEAATKVSRGVKDTLTRNARRIVRRKRPVKAARSTVKTTRRTMKTAQQSAKTAKKTAEVTVKAVKKAAQAAKVATKAAVQAAKAAAKVTAAVIKAIIAALKSLIAAIAAGGWVAVVIILVICMIAFILFSPLGIFYSSESFSGSQVMREVVSELNAEFYSEIESIENSVSHDILEYEASDGKVAVDWVAILSVYAVKTAGTEDSQNEVATLDDLKIVMIRQVMWDMNTISYSTYQKEVEREETYTDEYGNEQTRTEYETETVLVIYIEHKTALEIAAYYNFTEKQYEFLAELMNPSNFSMWVAIVGSYRDAGGMILDPDATWIGTGIFAWPMQSGYSITSPYGWRILNGEQNFHNGIDIGAPEGTPILAAAGGTVIVTNAVDEWGGGWGYYVRIHHDGTIYETLYAHCSAIAVYDGQIVEQGQVIGYVGDTGNSFGNHLHFEIYENGARVNPLLFFRQA